MSDPEPFVVIDLVAAHFSVSVPTIRAWVNKKRIPKNTYIKLGTTYRFKISAVEEALTAENETGDDSAAPEDTIALY